MTLPKLIQKDNLGALISQIEYLEKDITLSLENEDKKQADLRLKSGQLLLQAKALVKSKGMKWEIEAVNLIPKKINGRPVVGKTCRAERMKVAKLPGVENYTLLGWSKLVKIAELIKPTGSDVIGSLLVKCNMSLEEAVLTSSDEFTLIITLYTVKNDLKANNIKIPTKIIRKAIKRKIKFDNKLIKKLKQSERPDVVLLALTCFDTNGKSNVNSMSNNAVTTQIEEQMEKLSKTIQIALETGAIPEHIPGYVYEDLAHYLGAMFYQK